MDLENNQRSSSTLIIWNYWCRSKVLLYFDLECWDDDQRSSSTLIIWNRMMIKGPPLLWSGMLRWQSKVLFYFDNLELLMSIKGHSLLRSGILRWWSKVLFYFDNLKLLISIKSPPLLQSGIVMSIKGPLLFWSRIVEMSIDRKSVV